MPPSHSAVCSHRLSLRPTSVLCGRVPFLLVRSLSQSPTLPSVDSLSLPHLLSSTLPFMTLSSYSASCPLFSPAPSPASPFSPTCFSTCSFLVNKYLTATSGKFDVSSFGVRIRRNLRCHSAVFLKQPSADTFHALLVNPWQCTTIFSSYIYV